MREGGREGGEGGREGREGGREGGEGGREGGREWREGEGREVGWDGREGGGREGREGERWDGMYIFTTLSLVHRCTMTSDEPNVGTTRLRMALRQWAMEEQTIKLGSGIEVMVSSSCTYIIPSSDIPLCQLFDICTGDLSTASTAFSLSAPMNIVSIVLAGLLVAAVLMCVLLVIALVVAARRIKKIQW